MSSPRRLKPFLLLASLLVLAGCLPRTTGQGTHLRRGLVVDLRAADDVAEEDARGMAGLISEALAGRFTLRTLTTAQLRQETGGLMVMPVERRPAPSEAPRLILDPGLRELRLHLYLVGELTALEVRLGDIEKPLAETGFRRDQGVAALNLRLYLLPTGELLDELRLEAVVGATGALRRPPGTPVGDTPEFRDSLLGATVDEALRLILTRLEKTLLTAPWAGRVEEVTPEGSLILPLGYRDGARPGDVFIIYQPPESGETAPRGKRVGSARLESVGPDESLALPLSGGGFREGWLAVQEL